MTNCECNLAGWCNRHQCHKTEHMVHLCKTRDDYFDLWEIGTGPAQKINGKKPSKVTKPDRDLRVVSWLKMFAVDTDRGVGDIVERMLAKAGGRSIKSVLARIGVGCGCTNRQEWLNRKYPIYTKYTELSAGITLVTSLSLKANHLEVQSNCLNSWVQVGCKIVSQNTRKEIEQLRTEYPQVHEWVECDDVSDEYDYPTQRLYNLAKTASENNAAIINSDIEILGTQDELRSMLQRLESEFVLGIRWNYDVAPAQAREFEWGLDLITINKKQLHCLPAQMPYAIGQPMWDYAIPTLLMRAGFSARVPHAKVLFHKNHPQNWKAESHGKGTQWLQKFTGEQFDDIKFRKVLLDPEYIYDKSAGLHVRKALRSMVNDQSVQQERK